MNGLVTRSMYKCMLWVNVRVYFSACAGLISGTSISLSLEVPMVLVTKYPCAALI